MAKYAYNNAKYASLGHTPFELNCVYHPQMLYDKEADPRYKFKLADEPLAELRKLMIVCQKNLYYAQELYKQANDKSVKPRNYMLGDQV